MSDERNEIIQALSDRAHQWTVAMTERLLANIAKGGPDSWEQDSPRCLLYRVRDELRELEDEVSSGLEGAGYETQRIRREAADVANMAMMVADACDAAEKERVSGR